jgi:hypothetical protein
VGTNGFATGLSNGLSLYPFSLPDGTRGNETGSIPLDYFPSNAPCAYTTYQSYLGCAFGGLSSGLAFLGLGDGIPIATDGSNISSTAIKILQLGGPKGGLNQGFYVPSIPFGSNGMPISASPALTFAQPTRASENQYLGNVDYIFNPKNTVSEKFFYSGDPQLQSFVCLDGNGNLLNSCAPGAPEAVNYTSLNETLKLTTVATSSFVNEALFSFVRTTTVAVPGPGTYISACSAGITPPLFINTGANCESSTSGINQIPLQIPTISLLGLPLNTPDVGFATGPLNTGGNFFASATNYFNTFQSKDNISWNHGKHAIRAGAEVDRLQYNWTLPGRGGLDFPTVADFLTSSSGPPFTPAPAPNAILVNFYGLGEANGNPHDQRTNEFAAYVADDIKVTHKLTVNLGLRWEYDGYPSDNTGLFTNAWGSQAALVNTGSVFLGDQVITGPPCTGIQSACGTPVTNNNQIGTLAGYVVQSNYNPNIQRCGNPLAPSACGMTAAPGVFPGYPGGATGVFVNNNKTLVHGAPINDFAPRVGIAWQPFSEKFVVRAGWGIFYDAVYANLLANNNAGNSPYNGFVNGGYIGNALDTPIAPVATSGVLGWAPRTLQVQVGNPATGATLIRSDNGGEGIAPTSINEFIGVPLVQQYNLDLQYEVVHNWVIDIGYVGTHGTHLYDWAHTVNIGFLAPNAPNEPTDTQNERMILGSGAQGTPNSFAFNDVANTNPATQILSNTGNGAAYPGNISGRVSYLGVSSTGYSNTTTQGDSLYNSLQLQLRHQFSHGFLLQASYTWSKSITNINGPEAGSGIAAPGNVLSGGASSNDPLDFGQQYGLAAFNRPQRLIIAYSYELPYHNQQGLTGHVFSGWSVSGVTTIQDGEPFTVIDSNGGTIYGAGGFGGGGVRAELASSGNCNKFGVCQSTVPLTTSGSSVCRLGIAQAAQFGCTPGQGWINPAGFTSTPCIGGVPNPGGIPTDPCGDFPNGEFPGDPGYTFAGAGTGFGNSPVGAIMGPGQNNWDFSIMKNTKILEGLSTQFRAEFYNVWNHPQFNPPINNFALATTTFGQIQSSSVPPRIVQLALKFIF